MQLSIWGLGRNLAVLAIIGIPVAGFSQQVGTLSFPEDEVDGSLDRTLVACPESIDEAAPHRTVLQVIDNTVHRWHEYDLPRCSKAHYRPKKIHKPRDHDRTHREVCAARTPRPDLRFRRANTPGRVAS